jgi:lipopolysaccharide transport system permease protein
MLDRLVPIREYDAALPQREARARDDLREGLVRWRLAWVLARSDITHRYRGSVLGPLWLTLSTAVMLVCLGFLYSKLFQMDIAVYLPWLATSIIVWNVIAQIFQDGCTTLTAAEGIIRQMPLPYSLQALRAVFRNIIVTAHNLPLIAVVFLVFEYHIYWSIVFSIPGIILIFINAFWISLFLGIICARFRDIPPIIASIMQIAFFMSPVIWKPALIHDWAVYLPLNPFYVLMEVIRGPIVGTDVPILVWVAAVIYTAIVWAVAQAFFVRFRGRIAFWV